ncbi:MAG: elongation factor G [Anaerolineales bacterium]|nr:MAG: elongation factor G [Anaerolineales bacterium]
MTTVYSTDKLRNVVLLGHGSSGKTSLTEAMLFNTGAINRMGKVEEGTTVSDFDEEEIRRHISLNLSLISCEWDKYKINVLDTPGYLDFVGEVISAIRVADAGIVLVDAVAGVEVGTELAWQHADNQHLPRLVFINKMDRDNANFERTLGTLREKFEGHFVPIQLPIGEQANFKGVVDLLEMKAYVGEDRGPGAVPEDLVEAAEEARTALVEAAAEGDDELIMKYLDGEELTNAEIGRGLAAGIAAGTTIPVLCGSASHNVGVQALLHIIVRNLPGPSSQTVATVAATSGEESLDFDASGPLAAFVFKTAADPYVGKLTYFRVYSGTLKSNTHAFNSRTQSEERLGQISLSRGKEQLPVTEVRAGDMGVVAKLGETLTADTLCDKSHALVLPGIEFPTPLFAVAVAPKTKADSAKMGPSLTRIVEEDPTLRWRNEDNTRQVILEGMGDAHVDTAIRRLEQKFGLGLETSVPKVPYMETVTKVGSDSYRHKKQTGGAGQFAEVHMRVEPLSRDAGYEFEWEVFGGAISSSFQPSIQKGIRQVMGNGPLAGYPVVDVKAVVFDGKEHPVDSKDIAFQIAGREVFKQAFKNGNPVLLEPIMNMSITVPDEFMGDVMGDLTTRRGRVQGTDQERGNAIVHAQAPLADIQRYATDLRSFTQGRGIYTLTFSHYEQVPAHLQAEVIAQAERERQEAE